MTIDENDIVSAIDKIAKALSNGDFEDLDIEYIEVKKKDERTGELIRKGRIRIKKEENMSKR